MPDAQTECGTFEVFENREKGKGRKIGLHFAVLPALAATPEPDPLYILVGGPGQSATISGAPLAQLFHKIRRKRDIVLLDQRGTGNSNPLRCRVANDTLQDMFSESFQAEEVAKCLEALDADTRHYATAPAVEDLNQLRIALGHQRINLWSASYGTRVALAYLAQHGNRVRRIVLDGPVPTDIKLPLYAGRDAQRALDMLFEDCAKDTACASTFPGLRETLDALLEELAKEPMTIELRHPRTGKVEQLTVNRDAFAAALRMLLYAPHLSALLPLAVFRAREGDFSVLVTAVATIADQIDQDMHDGMFLSVVCAEDVPRVTSAEVEKLTQGNFLGRASLETLQQACSLWPTMAPPESFFAPVRGSAPTLVLSGQHDPIVPPAWGELVSQRLNNAQHIVVEGRAHGTSTIGCITDAIADFITSKEAPNLQVDCASKLKRPAFFLSYSGALP